MLDLQLYEGEAMKNFDLKQLENIPLFQGIRPDEIQKILTCCQAKPKHYQSHETIVHE